jgi:hypothetical protein
VAVATVPVLAVRIALWGHERTLALALAELVLWLAVLAAATLVLERDLLAELRGYLRRGRAERAGAEAAVAG